jgi:hypothetical protein
MLSVRLSNLQSSGLFPDFITVIEEINHGLDPESMNKSMNDDLQY